MSQKINHRRGEHRHQDNGPTFESRNPMAGCNSTHVARSRTSWKRIGTRSLRRTGKSKSAWMPIRDLKAPNVKTELEDSVP